jgi:hypothetical protein
MFIKYSKDFTISTHEMMEMIIEISRYKDLFDLSTELKGDDNLRNVSKRLNSLLVTNYWNNSLNSNKKIILTLSNILDLLKFRREIRQDTNIKVKVPCIDRIIKCYGIWKDMKKLNVGLVFFV